MQCTTPQKNIITINCTLSVGRQGDRNKLLVPVAKRAERAQLLVYYYEDYHGRDKLHVYNLLHAGLH